MEIQQEKQDNSSQQSIIFIRGYETRIPNTAAEEEKNTLLCARVWMKKNKIKTNKGNK
jgi:hypothetical protein